MFDKMKQLYDMQKKAKEMQKSVEALKVEKVTEGGKLRIVMNGSFKVEALTIDSSYLAPDKKSALENALVSLISEASEEAGKLSAQQAMAMMKELNLKLPGM